MVSFTNMPGLPKGSIPQNPGGNSTFLKRVFNDRVPSPGIVLFSMCVPRLVCALKLDWITDLLNQPINNLILSKYPISNGLRFEYSKASRTFVHYNARIYS